MSSHVLITTLSVSPGPSNCSLCVIVLLTDKYVEIEKQLIDDFRRAYYDGDLQRMKNITAILSNFKVIFDQVLTTLIILLCWVNNNTFKCSLLEWLMFWL